MKRKIIPYNPKSKEFAKSLRNNMTFGEVLLWNQIKGKKILGYGFNRQRPIDRYIVDFYCKELSLAIEVDGFSHHNLKAQFKDRVRQCKLESLGVKFLRFEDDAVKHNIDGVIDVIKEWIIQNRS